MSSIAVLGGGIVGTAAAWDLVRRGHQVVVSDVTETVAAAAAERSGASPAAVDVTDAAALRRHLDRFDAVVSAVPYALGVAVAEAAVATVTHYLDFGGNPTVVQHQLLLDEAARGAGIALVPDCGLAPGMANVLAVGAVDRLGDGPIDEVRLRVGALPVAPIGTLGYQLAFNPAGLINEYAEPCEVIVDGRYDTVEPLTGIEEVAWESWGPLEAFHTAGGSSSLAAPLGRPGAGPRLQDAALSGPRRDLPRHARGRPVRRVPAGGHRRRSPPGAPRGALAHLPSGDDDLVLVRVWATATAMAAASGGAPGGGPPRRTILRAGPHHRFPRHRTGPPPGDRRRDHPGGVHDGWRPHRAGDDRHDGGHRHRVHSAVPRGRQHAAALRTMAG